MKRSISQQNFPITEFLLIAILLVLVLNFFGGVTIFSGGFQTKVDSPIPSETEDFPTKMPSISIATAINKDTSSEIDFTQITFPDGSLVILEPNAEIEIINARSSADEPGGNEILLVSGEIVVLANLSDGEWFKVINPEGAISQVTGSRMVVIYDVATGEFSLGCIEGDCQIGEDETSLIDVPLGEVYVLDTDGELHGPFALEFIEDIFEIIESIEEGKTEPEGNGNISKVDAQATAACLEFISEFPLTPCPPPE